MGRPKNPIPRVHHHKSGRDRVRIAGVDHWLGRTGSPEAAAAYSRLLARLAAGLPAREEHSGPGVKVADVVAEWKDAETPRIAKRELASYKRAVVVLLRLFADLPAKDFTAGKLETVQQAMLCASWMTQDERARAEAGRKAVNWCRTYTNSQVGRIRSIFRWAERKGYAPEGRWHHLCTLPGIQAHDRRARNAPPRRAASREELDAVLPHCQPAIRAMLLLQWHTGMRPGEVRMMKAGEVNRDQDIWIYRPAAHKNDWRGQVRQVALGPASQQILSPFLLGLPADGFVFSPGLSGRHVRHPHYTADAFVRAVNRAAEKAGLPGFSSYQLRHSAKQRVLQELGLDHARSLLGQKSIEQTNEYGDALDLRLAKEAARKVG